MILILIRDFIDNIKMTNSEESDRWRNTIEKLFGEGKLRSQQCIVYNKDAQSMTTDEKCGCQRFVRHHSYDGPALETKPQRDNWNVKIHTQPLTPLIYHSTPSAKVSRNSILPLPQTIQCVTNRFSFCDVHVRANMTLKLFTS